MKNSLKEEVFITGATRTPIGKFSGLLSTTPATKLGALVLSSSIDRSNIPKEKIDYVILGNMLSAGLGQTPARQASIQSGIPVTTPAMTINKACASGLQAIILGAQSIQLQESNMVVAGGMENMSLSPHLLMDNRKGKPLGDTRLIDSLIHDGLWCPFENRHMGSSAEEISKIYNISREEQDSFAIRSHTLALNAIKEGWFKNEIVPIPIDESDSFIDTDEGPRIGIQKNKLSRLEPAFLDGRTVTAGNSSQISDGAAAVVLVSKLLASSSKVTPIARITGYANAANEPGLLFDAPRIAIGKLLKKTQSTINDFDLIEVNEAFAAQVLANKKALNWDRDKVNIQGGAIALGHPIGASGARIVVTLLYSLMRTKQRTGLAVICHAGGGALAISIEIL